MTALAYSAGESALGSIVHFLRAWMRDRPTYHTGAAQSMFGTIQRTPSVSRDERRTEFESADFRRLVYIALTLGTASSWLSDALRDLKEVAAGFEVEGPIPSRAVIVAARDFLVSLSSRIATDPGVDHDGSGGVGVEFVGRNGDRILFIIEDDVTASCHEYIEGKGRSRRYDSWSRMFQDIDDSWLHRAKIPTRDRPLLTHDTRRVRSNSSKASSGSETGRVAPMIH